MNYTLLISLALVLTFIVKAVLGTKATRKRCPHCGHDTMEQIHRNFVRCIACSEYVKLYERK